MDKNIKGFTKYQTLTYPVDGRKVWFDSSAKVSSFIKDLVKIPHIDEFEYYKVFIETTITQHAVIFKINTHNDNMKTALNKLLLKHKKNILYWELVY